MDEPECMRNLLLFTFHLNEETEHTETPCDFCLFIHQLQNVTISLAKLYFQSYLSQFPTLM